MFIFTLRIKEIISLKWVYSWTLNTLQILHWSENKDLNLWPNSNKKQAPVIYITVQFFIELFMCKYHTLWTSFPLFSSAFFSLFIFVFVFYLSACYYYEYQLLFCNFANSLVTNIPLLRLIRLYFSVVVHVKICESDITLFFEVVQMFLDHD